MLLYEKPKKTKILIKQLVIKIIGNIIIRIAIPFAKAMLIVIVLELYMYIIGLFIDLHHATGVSLIIKTIAYIVGWGIAVYLFYILLLKGWIIFLRELLNIKFFKKKS